MNYSKPLIPLAMLTITFVTQCANADIGFTHKYKNKREKNKPQTRLNEGPFDQQYVSDILEELNQISLEENLKDNLENTHKKSEPTKTAY
ncbi:MAG: hypothetical protein ABJH06_10620 [Paraglaciecola sp.]|uniref:hypothetical protein n=1 Tax=Paraglaciecola sp. TaxID=1920173 RepID=UPI003297DC02